MSLFAMTGDQIAAFARDGVMRLPGAPARALRLTALYHNLVRRWTEA
jgi:predicted 2-oxoglutarate/Fe(II)-dependent dioxygenase YbiX